MRVWLTGDIKKTGKKGEGDNEGENERKRETKRIFREYQKRGHVNKCLSIRYTLYARYFDIIHVNIIDAKERWEDI